MNFTLTHNKKLKNNGKLHNLITIIKHMSSQISTSQKRIIDRKDALIQRIVQSRQEPRSVENTAQFRDCSVTPLGH